MTADVPPRNKREDKIFFERSHLDDIYIPNGASSSPGNTCGSNFDIGEHGACKIRVYNDLPRGAVEQELL